MSKDTYTPVACASYDHLELACINGSTVELHTDGGIVAGTAVTLRIEDGAEVMVLLGSDEQTQAVRLDHITQVDVRAAGSNSAYTFKL